MREVVKAVVRGTVLEARAEAVTMEWTLQDGEVRKPVSGEAHTGDAYVHGGADDERSEPDGLGAAMSPKAASRAGVGTSAAKDGLRIKTGHAMVALCPAGQ